MKKIFYLACLFVLCSPAQGKLSVASFPGTFQDMSFKARIDIAREGYKPLLDKKAYQELNIVPGEEVYTDRIIDQMDQEQKQQESDRQNLPHDTYCAKYPDDTKICHTTQAGTQTTPGPTLPSPTQTGQQQPSHFSGRTIGGGDVIENNFIVGGSCYPAARDNNFTNTILTTGKYEKIHPALEKGLITIFRKEGACGTIKNDRCGYTCYGIGSGKQCAGVRVNSRAEAETVYYEKYWKPYGFERLPDVIATDVFLAGMASGPGTALQQFRTFLGLPKKTSSVDSEMIRAVNNYQGDIHNDWLNERDAFLQKVAQQRYKGAVSRGYKNAIELKRKNGCHVRPTEPLYR